MKGFLGPVLGLLLAILIIAIGHFKYHIPQGSGRAWLVGGAVIVWAGFAFGPKLFKRLFGRSLNNKAGR